MENISEILKAAIQSHQAGDLQKAGQLYCRVIENNPGHPLALHSLGIIAHQKGQNDIAAGLIAKAISSNPKIPQFHNTQGLVFEAVGKIDDAICSYKKAISLNPDYEEAHFNLAIALQAKGDFAAAVEKCSQIISIYGDSAKVYNLMGYSLEKQGDLSKAVESYRQAIRLNPEFAEAYNHLGVILNGQQRYAEAAENCKRALEIAPDYVEACSNLGVALNGIGMYAEAMENYRKAISLDAEYVEAYYNLANCLRGQNRCAEAIEIYRKVIRIKPDYADSNWNLALALLLSGIYIEGWEKYRHHRNALMDDITKLPGSGKPRWNGSSFVGKRLFIYHEQGLGDIIQLCRYLPMVKARGGTVILETMEPMLRLLRRYDVADEIIEYSPGAKSSIEFDFYTSMVDMPNIFAATVDTIPAQVPYLYAESQDVEYWQGRLAGGDFKVGIVWAGLPSHGYDKYRSCKLENFAPLAKIDGVRLYGLQKGPAAAQMDEAGSVPITNISKDFKDLADTAAAIHNLNLVISVDTSVLHLAGAMGKPVWALIPFEPEWRWMLDRRDSPWYPTMKLFRQKKRGDWDELLGIAAEQLRILVSKSS